MAGHTDCGTHRIDTHDNHVIDPVWELYRMAHRFTGGVSTLLEWDAKIPPFSVVHAEVLKAKQYMSEQLAPPRLATRRPTIAAPIPELAGETAPHPLSFVTAEVE